jgi:hypothetical protein
LPFALDPGATLVGFGRHDGLNEKAVHLKEIHGLES